MHPMLARCLLSASRSPVPPCGQALDQISIEMMAIPPGRPSSVQPNRNRRFSLFHFLYGSLP